jgi:dTDP-4-dehydrorhamnose reductase
MRPTASPVRDDVRVLITGASGMLGNTLAPVLARAGHDVVRHGHHRGADVSCDLTQNTSARALIDNVHPEVIVNLVAATDVDECERDPHAAYLLNVRTVENLVAAMREQFFIQLSTDQVYDCAGPSKEDDVRLTNTYALTKYAAELAAVRVPSTVLRTNFFGPSRLAGRKSFSDWALDSLQNAKPITVFEDVVISPLSMRTLSAMIDRVIKRRVAGIFNLGSRDAISKADLVFEIARAYGLSTRAVTRGSVRDVNLAAYRPNDMSMDCARFEAAFDTALPRLHEEIEHLKEGIA